MKRLLTAILLVLFCTAISLANDSDFKKVDKNNDGKVSKKEYLDAVKNTFNKIDKNKDGFLTKDELKAIGRIDAEKFLKEEDINKDNKISKEEFIKAAEKRFKLLDKNNDGFIDNKEWNDVKDNANQNNPKISPIVPFIIFRF
jgi:Ca2+-binding EF-hand superfamily protein